MLSRDKFYAICSSAKKENIDKYYGPLCSAMDRFDISTEARQAMFLVQLLHESGNFSLVVENLNYSASGLRRTFGKYYRTDAEASLHAMRPIKIASRVYANRMGNGSEASQDGWKYRGRGLIQITGANNYKGFFAEVGVSDPDYLLTPEGAALSAAWFWYVNKLNRFADKGDIVGCSKAINGGSNGLEERKALWEKAKKIISTSEKPEGLTIGSKGTKVKALQTALGITADGKFGQQTATKVKEFQDSVGIEVTGIADQKTLELLNVS